MPDNREGVDLGSEIARLTAWQEQVRHAFDALDKAVDDILWHQRIGDIAVIDKIRIVGPPPANTEAQSAQDKGNPVVFAAYTFVPRELDTASKHPLLVYPHGGVHANFSSTAASIVREMLEQGYIIVAPEYRGSTGYGRQHYELIDYGGLEIEDTQAARDWMVENCDLVDPGRVGIVGWSHGGLHALMCIFEYPESYQVAFAGVPVSDLVARMGYKSGGYHQLFSAPYHIGKAAYEDPAEYRRRSPAWHAGKLRTPLLIYTNTSDEDVNVLEVEHLIKSLKAEGKEFQYEIFENAPGGHVFDRLDTRFARECRQRMYDFLADYLEPSGRGDRS